MPDHAHKQIRAALVTALTGLTTTGARVYANRLYPMDAANLPGLRIYPESETSETITIHAPATQSRVLSVSVEACVSGTTTATLDDVLDQISKEVEIALAAGITVAGQTLDVLYAGMGYDWEAAERPVAVKRMQFSVPYEALSNAPDVLI